MTLSVRLEQARTRDVRVPLGRRDARVPQKFLNSPDVCPSLQQVRRERMSKRVWRHPSPRESGAPVSSHKATDVAYTQQVVLS